MNLHANCQGNTVLEFGCGCNKAKVSNVVNPTRRVTVYEVHVGNDFIAEFADLTAARAKAVEVKGRVKVTNKTETS